MEEDIIVDESVNENKFRYGFIYLTNDTETGKIYIGQRKRQQNPRDPDDSNYFGSGRIIGKIIKECKNLSERFSRIILEDCDSQYELNQREIYWIRKYNSTDPEIGYNKSFGGIFNVTEEVIEKRSESIRENLRNNPETHEKLSKAGIKRYEDPKEREKTSIKMKEVMGTDEMRKSQSEKGKMAQNKPEVKKRKIEAQLERWKDPEEREKMSEIQKIAQNKPETKEKRSKSAKESWKKNRQKILDGINKPETKEKWRKSMIGKIKPEMNYKSTPVICVELDMRFPTISAARKWLNKKGRGNCIDSSLRNYDVLAGGYHWKYENDNQLEIIKNQKNNSEKMKGRQSGKNNPFAKTIINTTTGYIIETFAEAIKILKISSNEIKKHIENKIPINGDIYELLKKDS